ncbi:hypothetical protein J3E74DRAFT_48523, partial [Bipolaris maydis]
PLVKKPPSKEKEPITKRRKGWEDEIRTANYQTNKSLKQTKKINRLISRPSIPVCLPALLLAHSPSLSPSTRTTYSTALRRQLDHLLNKTPRFPNGALSHRSAYPSLWSDFIYMGPPMLAYTGACTHDAFLLGESVRQCQLYCEVLGTPSGAWRHIANVSPLPQLSPTTERVKQDDAPWSTSNAWAAAGMARVLATLLNSPFAPHTKPQQRDLRDMIIAIVRAARAADTHPQRLLRNYLDDESAFADVAGTALMAAVVFRVAGLEGESVVLGGEYIEWAVDKMRVVAEHVDVRTGVAAPVVNSLRESQQMPVGEVNPEAQAFIVLLFAAWRIGVKLNHPEEAISQTKCEVETLVCRKYWEWCCIADSA